MNALKKYQRITVVFLLLIGIVNYLDRSALSIANTSIQRDMLISPSQMGILLSAFSVAYAFAQLPLGLIIDRLGSKIALGASLLAWSVAQSLCGLVNSFGGFMGLRVLLGIGEAPMFPRRPRRCRNGSTPTSGARRPASCGRRPAWGRAWRHRC